MIDPVAIINATRILTSEYAPKSEGTLPMRVVLWRKSNPSCQLAHRFGTHAEALHPDGETTMFWGHYDLSFVEAAVDFEKRCRDYDCPTW